MKIVIAPQAFKGNLSAKEAARAIARGVALADPGIECTLAPVADGGDGTVDVLVGNTGGRIFTAEVTGPLGEEVTARWGVMGDGRTAVIEMALVSGLALVPPRRRDPRITTSYGTGQLIRQALQHGYRRILVGLGGSATNDGGAGMAQALGARFLGEGGRELPLGAAPCRASLPSTRCRYSWAWRRQRLSRPLMSTIRCVVRQVPPKCTALRRGPPRL